MLAPLNLSGLLVTNPPLTMPPLSLLPKPSLASQTPPSLTLTLHRGLGKIEPDLCPNKLRCTWSSLICSISVKSSVGSLVWHRATTRHLPTFLSICQQIWPLLPHKFPPINIPSAQRTESPPHKYKYAVWTPRAALPEWDIRDLQWLNVANIRS